MNNSLVELQGEIDAIEEIMDSSLLRIEGIINRTSTAKSKTDSELNKGKSLKFTIKIDECVELHRHPTSVLSYFHHRFKYAVEPRKCYRG
jgi:hypothetical protein